MYDASDISEISQQLEKGDTFTLEDYERDKSYEIQVGMMFGENQQLGIQKTSFNRSEDKTILEEEENDFSLHISGYSPGELHIPDYDVFIGEDSYIRIDGDPHREPDWRELGDFGLEYDEK